MPDLDGMASKPLTSSLPKHISLSDRQAVQCQLDYKNLDSPITFSECSAAELSLQAFLGAIEALEALTLLLACLASISDLIAASTTVP